MQAVTNIQPPVKQEFHVQRIAFLSVSKYAGLLVGASFWPMTADFIGRRLAFNVTLLITAIAGLVGAGMPTFGGLATLCALVGFGSGGNQPVDSAIFLEFIPATHQNILVIQSGFWALGQVVANMVAWYVLLIGFPKRHLEQTTNTARVIWQAVYCQLQLRLHRRL